MRILLWISFLSIFWACRQTGNPAPAESSTTLQKTDSIISSAEPSRTASPEDSTIPVKEVFQAPSQPLSDTLNKGFWEERNSDVSTLLMSTLLKNPENRNRLTEVLLHTERDQQHREMARMAGMDVKEIQLLEQLPTKEYINNERRALALVEGKPGADIDNHLRSGQASELFQKLVSTQQKALEKHSRSLLKKSDEAKALFQKENPNMNLSAGNTYFDEKGRAVHLPLGDISFADAVVAHYPGKPEGKFPERALGKPDYTGDENKNMAHIGYGGVLTLYFSDNAIVDVQGPDLYVFEAGAIEPTQLEISKDGENWINIGKIKGGTAAIDIAGFVPAGENFHYVRFTDLKSPSDIPGADIDAVAAIGSAMRLTLNSSVLFDFGQYTLKEEAGAALKELANTILSVGGGTITVEGHTDDIGQDDANTLLSERRAESVANELKKRISGSKFKWKIIGYGESRPFLSNDSEEHREQNRRVEILVTP